jgi:hypothetical protein
VFAAWRLASIIQTNAGRSTDLSWGLPGPTLLSICEIDIAVFVASVPFFWPILREQFTQIFVKYEFNVSTESRFQQGDDDTVELSRMEASHMGKSGGIQDVKSVKSEDYQKIQERSDNQSFQDSDYVRAQVDPFSEDFQTETIVHTGGTDKNHGGFVRFKK